MKTFLSLFMAGLLVFAAGCSTTDVDSETTDETIEEELPPEQTATVTNMILVNAAPDEEVVLSEE